MNRYSILVVEDDTLTQQLEGLILENEGFSVKAVDDGESALEFLQFSNPCLVILDVNLPGMDGFATCDRIRQFCQVPIIIVTGGLGAADGAHGLEVGADDYIAKPFSPSVFVARVRAVLRRAGFARLPEPQVPLPEIATTGALAYGAMARRGNPTP